jgi:hypothetical protein
VADPLPQIAAEDGGKVLMGDHAWLRATFALVRQIRWFVGEQSAYTKPDPPLKAADSKPAQPPKAADLK